MELPRAEIRYRGIQAVGVSLVRGWHRFASWLRPRVAPLAITALATACMLAGLDLIAHDFRKLHAPPAAQPRPLVIYLMRMPAPATVIPVELLPAPAVDPSAVSPALPATPDPHATWCETP